MASSVPQEHWPDLSGLGLTDVRNADSRAALLVVNAEMFADAPTRDRDIIETFEALALGFLPRMDDATLVKFARIVAPCEDTPQAILDHLLRRLPQTRDIVLAHMAHFPPPLVKQLLGTADGRLRLARHPALAPATVDQLLVMHEKAVDDALAANRSIAAASPAMRELVRRGRRRLSLGTILLERAALMPMDEAALYLAANVDRRRQIRDRLAASVESGASSASNLTEYEVAAFLAAAQAGDVTHFEALMTYAFGYPAGTHWHILATGRQALLPLALKALGFVEKEAIRVFLHLHPALAHSLSTVIGLVRTMRDVSPPVAATLVKAILDQGEPLA